MFIVILQSATYAYAMDGDIKEKMTLGKTIREPLLDIN